MRAVFNKLRGRSVLITGGLGFIGSSLARRLVEIGGVRVTIIDSLEENQGGNIFNVRDFKESVSVHVADLSDEALVKRLVKDVDYVFNLAGGASHIDSMLMPHKDLKSNCAIHLSLLEACRIVNPKAKIVFTSTRQVYGRPQYLPVDEEHPVQPTDINGINKHAAEMYHLLYQRFYGIRTVVLRLTNTYGPGQQMRHDRQGFLPWFLRKAIDGDVIELYEDGARLRDLNYVDDVVDALLLTAASETTDNMILNLGHHQMTTLRDVAERIIQITGRGSIRNVPFPHVCRLTEIGSCYSSYEKIRRLLDWSPQFDLTAGLERTVRFYEINSKHYWSPNGNSVSRS